MKHHSTLLFPIPTEFISRITILAGEL